MNEEERLNFARERLIAMFERAAGWYEGMAIGTKESRYENQAAVLNRAIEFLLDQDRWYAPFQALAKAINLGQSKLVLSQILHLLTVASSTGDMEQLLSGVNSFLNKIVASPN